MAQDRYRNHKSFFKKIGARVLLVQSGSEFLGLKVKDPLFNRVLAVIPNEDIRLVYGSGINTVCPAYYVDDLYLGNQYGLPRQGYIDESGNINDLLGADFKGLSVLDKSADAFMLKKYLTPHSSFFVPCQRHPPAQSNAWLLAPHTHC